MPLVRNGPLYRARVPLEAIAAITPGREAVRGEARLVVRPGEALLPARRRVDAWLELRRAVLVERPFGEPVLVHRLAIAVDDPDTLLAAVAAGHDRPTAAGHGHAVDVVLGLDLARDALAPA